MRKIITLLFVLMTITGFSQKNTVKIGLPNIGYNDYLISYERALTPKTSVDLTIGIWATNLLADKFIPGAFEEGWIKGGPWLSDMSTCKHISLAYRMYAGNYGGLKGFYFAPYLRAGNLNIVLNDKMPIAEMSDTVQFNVNTKVNAISVGLQLGYQWVIVDKITIDWYLLGLGIQKATVKGEYQAVNVSGFNDYSSIESSVVEGWDKYPQIDNHKTVDIQDSYLGIKTFMWLPDIGFGFKIGYAF